MKRMTLCALAAVLLAGPGWAQDDDRRISVTGSGEVETAPDMAVIGMGVTEEAEDPAAAMNAASDVSARILDRLESEGLAARDVQTSQLTLHPVWSDGPTPEDERRITGYRATQQVTVRLRDLEMMGGVLQAVVEDGANRFDGLQFTLQDPDPVEAEARRRAVADAMERAALYAEAAGVELGEVVTISEPGGGYQPPAPMMEMARSSGGGAPVSPGEITVSAQVNMVFGIEGDADDD